MRTIIFILVASFIACCSGKHNPEVSECGEPFKELIVEYSDTDSVYRYYGYCKEIYRIYNYSYHDSTRHTMCYYRKKNGEGLEISVYTNEYNDTVCIRYIDLFNYPRRED